LSWRKRPKHAGARIESAIRNFAGHVYFPAMRSTYAPCIPTASKAVPARPEWLHEVKYDGLYEASRVKKFSRSTFFLLLRFRRGLRVA